MGFSCLRFLSRFAKTGLGIVALRRTLRHLRPYTFKQTLWSVNLAIKHVPAGYFAGLPKTSTSM